MNRNPNLVNQVSRKAVDDKFWIWKRRWLECKCKYSWECKYQHQNRAWLNNKKNQRWIFNNSKNVTKLNSRTEWIYKEGSRREKEAYWGAKKVVIGERNVVTGHRSFKTWKI